LSLELKGEDDARYSRLAESIVKLDLRPLNVLRIGFEDLFRIPSSYQEPKFSDELKSRSEELNNLRADLTSKKEELENFHRRKMRYVEDRVILEYYLEIMSYQMKDMEERLRRIDEKSDRSV
jgi:hypothetical protein